MTEDPKKPWWRTVLAWPWKAWVWLRTRRSARAVAKTIASNQVATAALAASVAAAGIGSYATVNAREAESQAEHLAANMAVLAARVDRVENDLVFDRAELADTKAAISSLDKRDAKAIAALGNKTALNAERVGLLASDLAKIPPSPDIAPLASRVASLAKDTASAAKAAREALGAARGASDPKAQAAANAAAAQAAQAEQAAQAAQATADAAAARALLAGPKGDKGDPGTPGEPGAPGTPAEPTFPRTVTVPDVVTTQVAGATSRAFTVDLPKGAYSVTLSYTPDTGASAQYMHLTAPGLTGTSLTTGGGTTTFTLTMDATQNFGAPAAWRDISVTIEKVNP